MNNWLGIPKTTIINCSCIRISYGELLFISKDRAWYYLLLGYDNVVPSVNGYSLSCIIVVGWLDKSISCSSETKENSIGGALSCHMNSVKGIYEESVGV